MAKILMLDDEKTICAVVSQFLEMEGHEVVTANSAEEAFSCLLSFTPELIITELVMPEFNGLQFLSKVRKDLPSCRFIIFTLRLFSSSH